MHGFNFTERTRRVLALAREEAARLHHEYVGTEHILLGLIREGEGIAATVLLNLGAELDDVQGKIEATVKMGRASSTTGPDLPYTSRAKKVLELAMGEAHELNHRYVGTEHLLLGLLAEGKGIAAQVLLSSGITVEEARAETLRLLGTELERSAPRLQPFATSHLVKGASPPAGGKPARVRVVLQYSNGRVVARNFDSAAEAARFLSTQ